ncbi:MAG TPA: AMP-binding protein [Myxococcaceae bacterium]|nr:AMP-binding protein [Myxococcaceae bacterium]
MEGFAMGDLRSSNVLSPELEMQTPAERQAYLGERLRATVARAYARAAYVKTVMDRRGLSPSDICRLEDLPKLPMIKKDELAQLQGADLPFAGLLAANASALKRIYMSPGPNYVPEPQRADFWRFRFAFASAGFRAGDIVQNTLSYHLSPGGLMMDAGLRSLGCVVIPAGVGQTDLQIRVAADVGVTGYVGTPSFLYTLLTKAKEAGRPLKIKSALVTAEMLPESLRAELEKDFGIRVVQAYGTADLGLLAYECAEKKGMHLHPEAIVEIVDLETQRPAEPGQPGLLVATTFDESYPLLRFVPGDISSFAADQACPCGRTAPKLNGILGRVGDAVKVKGMFVRGSQLEEVFKNFSEVRRFQAVVTRQEHQDALVYLVELGQEVADRSALASRLGDSLKEALKVRGEVQLVAPGTIGEGAKRIDDRRVWK